MEQHLDLSSCRDSLFKTNAIKNTTRLFIVAVYICLVTILGEGAEEMV
jgi:hypothetical protein